MVDQKFETASSNSDYIKSECVSGTEDSVSSSQTEKIERVECKKKLKKVKPIRLLRYSSMRSSKRREKTQYDNLSIFSSDNSERPTPIGMSDASPNYMKATSSSHVKESFQGSQRMFTRKTLTRMSTLKLKRSLTRKLSGGTDLKRKLKSSRSITLATVKGLRSTRQVKSQGKISPLDSESINGSNNGQYTSPSDVQQCLNNAGDKSLKVITRRLSLKPVRILTKVSTFKSKSSSIERGSQISLSQASHLHKPTCSSTLKDSHLPDHIDLPQEGNGSQKICSYSYCSLHGHRHDDLPPLKRFVSMRRRTLKTQKSVKMESRPVSRSRYSGNGRKVTQKSQTIHSDESVNKTAHSSRSHFQKGKKLARDSNVRHHDDEEKSNFRHNAEVLLGETSFPHVSFEKYLSNSLAAKGYPLFSFLAIKETNVECCGIATEKDKSDSKVNETAENDKNMDALKKNDESAIMESATMNVIMSSSDIETLEGEIAMEDKKLEPDNEILQVSSLQNETKSACTTDVASKMQEKDYKYVRKWHLIYKHAVLSNTGKGENKLHLDGKDKEGTGKDTLSFNGVNNSSCKDYCEKDEDMDDENKNVIELVQKAFDDILLPDSEDLSSDDHLKSSCINADEELIEKSEAERGERNTLTSRESPKKETWKNVDNFRSHKEEITVKKMGTKPDQKATSSWSNLKKLILLKRFVKALEKVRNFNIRRHRRLPSDVNLEAEKVYLRHLTAEEKKNSEEWMLDYALQKVISKLAPAQKRKVALLVEAFETILPFQEAENGTESVATVESQANPVHSLDDSSVHSKEETNKEMDNGHCADSAGDNPIVLKETCLDYPSTETMKNTPASGAVDEDSNGKESLARSYDNGWKRSIVNDNMNDAEIKDSRSWSFSKAVDKVSSNHEEAPANEIVNEDPHDLTSNLYTDISNSESELPGGDFVTKNLISANGEQFSMSRSLILKGLVRSLESSLVGSGLPSDLSDEPKDDRKESEAPKSAAVELDTQLKKPNYTGMWYLVYKHMVSGIAANDSELVIDGEDEQESVNEGTRTRGTSVFSESVAVMNKDVHFKDHGVADPELEKIQQIEAIKMVEEAIDAILPDVQDHLPDGNSLTDKRISQNSKKWERTKRVDSEDLNQKQERAETGNGITQDQKEEEEEKPAPEEGNKPKQQLPRSWSNLKKVILLRRFIKALEKVRKLNPRGPRYLPLEPDSEAEKVYLRHQEMKERKGTEEWMLDHALRQVVAELTPARKRKVELLVEAFETVMPTIKN